MRVRTLSWGELVIHGKGVRRSLTMCSAARAQRYFHHGCLGFMAYVVDNRFEGMSSLDGVPIVREFPEVFLEDLLGVTPDM